MSWQATAHVIRLEITLTNAEKLLLMVLAHYYSNQYGAAWPSTRTLARDALMSPRHVKRLLVNLEKKAVLEVERKNGCENVYRFASNPDSTGDIATSPLPNVTGDIAVSPPPVTFRTPTGDILSTTGDIAMSPNKTIEPTIEPTSRTDNRAQGRARSREPTGEIIRTRDPDPYLEVFEEAFLGKYQVFYLATKADFVKLAEMKKTQRGEVPLGDWERACGNYFATELGKHTIADLCGRYAVFRKSALDRYNKPLVASRSSDKTRGNEAALLAFVALNEEKK
jgi:hypothetical protein